MEGFVMGLILLGVFVFGFYVVDLFGRFSDGDGRSGDPRPSGRTKSVRDRGLERFFH